MKRIIVSGNFGSRNKLSSKIKCYYCKVLKLYPYRGGIIKVKDIKPACNGHAMMLMVIK
jgi:hypothetical protein